MAKTLLLLLAVLQATSLTLVHSAKQQLMLSDSYLPVAMQVIAHLTDQMAFEVQADEPVKPSAKPPVKPSTPAKPTKPSKPADTPVKPSTPAKPTKPSKPADTPVKPSKPAQNIPSWVQNKPTTQRPTYVYSSPFFGSFQKTNNNGWGLSYGIKRLEQTTPFHRPGLYAPVAPPRPGLFTKEFLLPIDDNSQYTVIEPLEKHTEEPLLSIENTEIKPLVEPKPEEEHLLPPHFDGVASRTSEDMLLNDEELTDDNLQYLSPNVRDMIKMAYDPDDDRVVDVLGDLRLGGTASSKAKLSSTNLRLLLLYDLLSREAKKQKLNDYSGFSDSVLRELVDSASGGARAQLSFALSRMLDRRDCDHEYANNRAKEMVAELAKDESPMSAEIRYLQPLVYRMFS